MLLWSILAGIEEQKVPTPPEFTEVFSCIDNVEITINSHQ
jgi:hypothetical protein